jgi:TctA family transporter
MRRTLPSTPPRFRTAVAALAGAALIAWMLLSDDGNDLVNNGGAGNALSVAVGFALVAFLLAMLVLLLRATSRGR